MLFIHMEELKVYIVPTLKWLTDTINDNIALEFTLLDYKF